MKPSLKLRSFLFACGSLLSATSTHAADGTWTLNNNGNWSDAATANWQDGVVADGVGFSAYFSNVISGNRNITLSGDRTIGNIYAEDTSHNYSIIGASTLTLDASAGKSILDVVTGRTLTISAPVTVNDGLEVNGDGAVTLSGGVTLGNSQTWDNSGSMYVSGVIGDGGNTYGITKTGSARLDLGGVNHTFSGGLTINGGEVQFRKNDDGGANNGLGVGNLTINGGAAAAYWSYSFSRAQGTGAGEVQITGGISGFGGNGGNGGTFNIGDVTWGSATFNPTEFLLQTAGANTNGNSIFSSNIDLNGANRTIRSDQTGGDIVSGVGRFTGNITNGGATAGLIKTGIGAHILSGTNTYDGGTTITEGTLRFDSIAAMPDSGNVQVNNGAILGIKLGGGGNWSTGTTGVGTLGGLLAGDGGAGTSTVGYSGNVGVQLEVAANSTYSGNISDVGTTLAIHKTGVSSLTLNGNNNYSGGTFLYQGSLIADSANALGSGDITFKGGTLQYTANTAATDFGSQFANSTSAMLLNTNSQDVDISGIDSSNTGGLTKSGAGTLTFTGTNTYSGATTLSAGGLAIYDGTLNTSGAAVSLASNTTLSVLGGSGVSSTWNLGNQDFQQSGSDVTNIQVTVDGDGVEGSAVVTNVRNLIWGRTITNSTLQLTDGGQMNVTGEVRIGNPYYSENGVANLTIGGGSATSTFSGDGGDDFYIGYGERTGSKDNVVTVNTGGVLTNVRDMYVGNVNNTQNNLNPSTNNQLLVTGGTASMRGLSLGYATVARSANANVVEVTNGGELTTSGTNYIGRANASGSTSNDNTLTVSGTDSSWNAGTQDVYVGHTNNSTAQSNGNILTVGTGAELTNVNNLTVGFGAGTATGNQLVVNGILSVTTLIVSTGNTLSGSGTITGAITINGTLSPGNSPGQLTVLDSLGLGASSTTLMEIGGTTLGAAYDNISFAAAATLVYGGSLNVVNFGGYDIDSASATYDLFSFTDVPTGEFASVTVNGVSLTNALGTWSGDNGGVNYSFSQDFGDLSVAAIPEPSSAALLGVLGAMTLLRRRR